MTKLFAIITAMILSSTTLHAADFNKGLTAYKSGDYTSAMKEFEPLAEEGDTFAQYSLGFMYKNGQGVVQDYKEAVKWYRRAAEQGHAGGQSNLGVMYNNGQGVVQEFALAHMWFNIAAANGNDTGNKNRDNLAANMTLADISKAQSFARECMNSNYKNCGG